MSDEFEQRAQDVMRRAAQGMASFGALNAYGYRVLVANQVYNRLKSLLNIVGPRLVNNGSVGDPFVAVKSCDENGNPGASLKFDLQDRAMYVGGSIKPTPDILDFNMFIDNGRIYCGANGCVMVTLDSNELYVLEPVIDENGNRVIALGSIWWRVRAPDGSRAAIPLRLGPNRDYEVAATCLGLTIPGSTLPECDTYELKVNDVTVAKLPACLAAAEISGDEKHTYHIVESLGYFKSAPVVPTICEQEQGGGGSNG